MNAMNGFTRLAPYALAYGLARKIVHVSHATQYNYKTKKNEDLFLVTKTGIVILGGFSNVCYWPINIVRDLHAFEAYVRGVELEMPNNALEYLIA